MALGSVLFFFAGTNGLAQGLFDSSITPSFSHKSSCFRKLLRCFGFRGLNFCLTGLAPSFSSTLNSMRSVVPISTPSGSEKTSEYSSMIWISLSFITGFSFNISFSSIFSFLIRSSIFGFPSLNSLIFSLLS